MSGTARENRRSVVDFDIHGIVGVRLLNATPQDQKKIENQLGRIQKPLLREPDIVIRFVDELPLENLVYIEKGLSARSGSEFVLTGVQKEPIRLKFPFENVGRGIELIAQSGLPSVPHLTSLVVITALNYGFVAVHASAFEFKGKHILVTGWAKGGKSEALLAFSRLGAQYIGDEWILIREDGERICGIPERIRLWDWHLRFLPEARRNLNLETRLLFRWVDLLDGFFAMVERLGLVGRVPFKYLRKAMPAIRKQKSVQLPPHRVFPRGAEGPFEGGLDLVFLMLSHESSEIEIRPVGKQELIGRMLASLEYELLPFYERYLEFKFAFPERVNPFLEQVPDLQRKMLCQALESKPAWSVAHPYPVDLVALGESMESWLGNEKPEVNLDDGVSASRFCEVAPK